MIEYYFWSISNWMAWLYGNLRFIIKWFQRAHIFDIVITWLFKCFLWKLQFRMNESWRCSILYTIGNPLKIKMRLHFFTGCFNISCKEIRIIGSVYTIDPISSLHSSEISFQIGLSNWMSATLFSSIIF